MKITNRAEIVNNSRFNLNNLAKIKKKKKNLNGGGRKKVF